MYICILVKEGLLHPNVLLLCVLRHYFTYVPEPHQILEPETLIAKPPLCTFSFRISHNYTCIDLQNEDQNTVSTLSLNDNTFHWRNSSIKKMIQPHRSNFAVFKSVQIGDRLFLSPESILRVYIPHCKAARYAGKFVVVYTGKHHLYPTTSA